jgi:hypothetical protein
VNRRALLPVALTAALGACVAPFTWSCGYLTRPMAGAVALGLILVALGGAFLSE